MRPASVLGIRLSQGGNRCDFCGSAFIHKMYRCSNFEFAGRPVFKTESGRWAACLICSEDVDSGRWQRLTNRVLRGVRQRGLAPKDLLPVRAALTLFHAELKKRVEVREAFTVRQCRYSRV